MEQTSGRKQRVSILISNLMAGGAERVTLNLIDGLVQLGCEVQLVLFSAVGELLADVPEGIEVIDLACERAHRGAIPLARYLRHQVPDVLIGTEGHANIVAYFARLLAGVETRLVFTEHLALTGSPRNIRDRLYRLLASRIYRRVEAVVAVSGGVADSLVRGVGLPRESISVIYNPVLTEHFWETVAEPVEDPWFAPGGPPVILGVGRLVAQKDFPTLLKAFARVRQTHEARLMILGEGPDRRALEAQALELGLEGQVRLPGFVSKPASYMAHSSVFVLSSVREGLPTVLIEALAAGVPVVATNCESGPMEILDGGKLGRLVPVGAPEELGAAIIAALDDGKCSVEKAILTKYSPKEAARRYLEVAGSLA